MIVEISAFCDGLFSAIFIWKNSRMQFAIYHRHCTQSMSFPFVHIKYMDIAQLQNVYCTNTGAFNIPSPSEYKAQVEAERLSKYMEMVESITNRMNAKVRNSETEVLAVIDDEVVRKAVAQVFIDRGFFVRMRKKYLYVAWD